MVRELVHDPLLLGQRAEKATRADKQVITDLIDTLKAHRENCVGMAANMIGENKAIIIVAQGTGQFIMVNPVITMKKKEFETEEGCLSLLGGPRKVTRYEEIEVEYMDYFFKKQKKKFTGFTAQIIQHEVDHCNGILI